MGTANYAQATLQQILIARKFRPILWTDSRGFDEQFSNCEGNAPKAGARALRP